MAPYVLLLSSTTGQTFSVSQSDSRRIYRGADKIFTVSKCKNWVFLAFEVCINHFYIEYICFR